QALTEPCLSLSTHTACVINEELPPFATISRFLLLPVDQSDRDANDLPPLAPRTLLRFVTTTGQSAPELRIRTFTLMVLPLVAYPLASKFRVPRSVQLPHGKLRPPLMPDAAPPVSRYRRSYSHSSYTAAVLDVV